MVSYKIFNPETKEFVSVGEISKKEAIKECDRISKETGKAHEVLSVSTIHTSQVEEFDFSF